MYSNLPSLNALRAFEATARHLSFTRAARELHVTPAAVKQLVSKLEASLGHALILRQGQALVLTDAGRRGQARLSDGLRLMAEAVEAMRPVPARHRLTVSVDPFFAATWLVPRLTRFRDLHPESDVLIDSTMEIRDLQSGDADIAIRYGVAPEKGLRHTRLFEDGITPVFSPRLVNDPPRIKKIEDLRDATLLHWDLSSTPWAVATAYWFSFETWFATSGLDPPTGTHSLHFSDYNLAIQASIAGQGIVLGSWPIIRAAMDAGLLIAPFGSPINTDIGYDVVVTEIIQREPAIRDFCNWLVEEARAEPRWAEVKARAR
ncbi:MAG: LysR substrate-binding domain-containing protein [Pseudomonadota bacterium]